MTSWPLLPQTMQLILYESIFPLETTISPKEVIISSGAQQCFICTTTLLETHWLVNGVHITGNATPNGDLRVDTFCSTFTSNTTIACFGEPTSNSSEADSAQVIIINEGELLVVILYRVLQNLCNTQAQSCVWLIIKWLWTRCYCLHRHIIDKGPSHIT